MTTKTRDIFEEFFGINAEDDIFSQFFGIQRKEVNK